MVLPPGEGRREGARRGSQIVRHHDVAARKAATSARGCRCHRASPGGRWRRSRAPHLRCWSAMADDAAVANADIGAKLVAGRHDGAAANGEIELRHMGSPRCPDDPCFRNSVRFASPRICVLAVPTWLDRTDHQKDRRRRRQPITMPVMEKTSPSAQSPTTRPSRQCGCAIRTGKSNVCSAL